MWFLPVFLFASGNQESMLGFPGPTTAGGGITFDAKSGTSGSAVSVLTAGLTVAEGSNKILIALIIAEDGTDSEMVPLTMTWNTTESFTASVVQLDTGDKAMVYYLLNPTATTSDVVCTFTGVIDSCAMGVASFQGVAQTTPDNTATASPGAATAGTISITPVANHCLVVMGTNKRTATGSITAYGSPAVEISTQDVTNCDLGSSYDILIGGAGVSRAMTWTQGSSANETVAATFAPAQ